MEVDQLTNLLRYLADNQDVLVGAVGAIVATGLAGIAGVDALWRAFRAVTNGVAVSKLDPTVRADDAVAAYHRQLGPLAAALLRRAAKRANVKHARRIK